MNSRAWILSAVVASALVLAAVAKPLHVERTVVDPNTSFGHDMLQYFMMEEGYINMNHGAFGTVARPVYEAEQSWYGQQESTPNFWYRGGYQPPLIDARQKMSKFVSANESDLVIIENASAGLNAVLRSLALSVPLRPGDLILRTSVAYPMVQNVYQYIATYYDLEIVNVTIQFPITSPDAYLKPVAAALAQYGSRIKVATFDHISSYPASILPIKQLAAMCHQYGIIVVVDGAHVAGQIALNVTDVDADFYISNAHKWLYSPKGSAMLWAKHKVHDLVVPGVLSSEYDNDYVDAFAYTGTRNYCAFLAISAALDFRDAIGGNAAIFQYIHNLAWTSANAIAGLWNTTLMVPVEAMNGALVDIVTPTQDGGLVGQVRAELLSRYNTYIQTSVYDNVWYLRISAQIYLEASDFTLMAQRFLQLMNELAPQRASDAESAPALATA